MPGRVVTYENNDRASYCQVQLDSGQRVVVSIATHPEPSFKVIRMALGGFLPRETIWQLTATMAGGYEPYADRIVRMFLDVDDPLKEPLDVARDLLLRLESIDEVRLTLLALEAQARRTTPTGEAVKATLSQVEAEQAEQIVNEYGATLAAGKMAFPVSSLPYPKQVIKEAIRTYMKILHQGKQLTPKVEESLIAGYTSLADFIDDDSAKIVEDHFTAMERGAASVSAQEATEIFSRLTATEQVLGDEIARFRTALDR